jgi:hypothetical protein
MPGGVFVPDLNWIDELPEQDPIKDKLAAYAEAAKAAAERTAPIGFTGDYQSSFQVGEFNGEILLSNTDFKAHWIEFGTIAQLPQAIIRNAVRSTGIRLDESS